MAKKNKMPSVKTLDGYWSKLVKLRAGNRCEVCGRMQYLNSHHIFSRSKYVTRWDVENGVCLCPGCHTLSSVFSAHKTPIEFVDWLYKTKGKKFIDKLRLKSNQPYGPNRDEIGKILRLELKKYD